MPSNDRVVVHDLAALPDGTRLRAVTASPAEVGERRALKVQLTDEASNGRPGIDFIDMPTFAILPSSLRNGTISVGILGRLTRTAPDYARAFAGIAYRIVNDGDAFEAVYIRPLNGMKVNPPHPRDKRAVQYFSYPDWRFDRLREDYPDGRFEAGADIGPDEWTDLRIDIDERRLTVFVADREVLALDETKGEPVSGRIGLFVDIGTEAYFSNLTIRVRD